MFAMPTWNGARALIRYVAICGAVWGAIQLATLSSANAQVSASSPMIFDVRRSLPLEPDEPVYHDFYINAGPEIGIKKGMYLTVVRQVPVHDPVQNKQQGTLSIGVARLQVIHVERGLTVARLHSEFSDEERPTLEFEAVMIGDRIDPLSMTLEAPNSKKKKPGKAAFVKPIEASRRAEVDADVKTDAKPNQKPEPASVPREPVSVPVPAPQPVRAPIIDTVINKTASPREFAPAMLRASASVPAL